MQITYQTDTMPRALSDTLAHLIEQLDRRNALRETCVRVSGGENWARLRITPSGHPDVNTTIELRAAFRMRGFDRLDREEAHVTLDVGGYPAGRQRKLSSRIALRTISARAAEYAERVEQILQHRIALDVDYQRERARANRASAIENRLLEDGVDGESVTVRVAADGEDRYLLSIGNLTSGEIGALWVELQRLRA